MKRTMTVTIGLIMSLLMLFAFTACGGSGSAPQTPEEQAAAALDENLAALKSADKDAIAAVSGGEDVFAQAEEAFGTEEGTQTVLNSMFGHFDYTIGTPEKVDDSNVNVPVTVSNANMKKAFDTLVSDLMAYALQNPEIASDQTALRAKIIEMLQSAVDKTAEAEDGIVTSDVVFPMTLINGKWEISDTVDESVPDAVLGGFMEAIRGLTGGVQ